MSGGCQQRGAAGRQPARVLRPFPAARAGAAGGRSTLHRPAAGRRARRGRRPDRRADRPGGGGGPARASAAGPVGRSRAGAAAAGPATREPERADRVGPALAPAGGPSATAGRQPRR